MKSATAQTGMVAFVAWECPHCDKTHGTTAIEARAMIETLLKDHKVGLGCPTCGEEHEVEIDPVVARNEGPNRKQRRAAKASA